MMKFRPEMVFYHRKKKLGLSRLRLSNLVFMKTNGEIKLTEYRLQKLEDENKCKSLKVNLDELGVIFDVLEARPDDFWK